MKPILEIRSQSGELHFRRWKLFSCFGNTVYLHRIYKADQDKHLHDHPWRLKTVVLKGGYTQKLFYKYGGHSSSSGSKVESVKPFRFKVYYPRLDYHKIMELKGVTTSLAIVGPRENDDWGYMVYGKHIPNKEYRDKKKRGFFS